MCADEREHELQDEYAYACSQLTLTKRRLAKARVETRAKLAISSCKLSVADREELLSAWERGICTAQLKGLRTAAHLAPSPPPASDQRALSRHSVSLDPYASVGVPNRCVRVCRRRAAFPATALTFTRDGLVRVYMWL